MERWRAEVQDSRDKPRWRRVSGVGNLSPRCLAIVRELWMWRRAEAERKQQPPRRILRHDLMVELAKRKSDDIERIQAVRGMHRGMKPQMLKELAACIHRGMEASLVDLERAPAQHLAV